MRTLNTGDIFKVLQIFRAAGLKDEFAGLLDMSMTKENREKIGSRIFALLFDCLGNERAEPLILKLLADISGGKPEDIAKQPIKDTIALLKQLVKQNDIKSFFEDAASLT